MNQIVISSSVTPPTTSTAPSNTTPTQNLPATAPDPRFSYMDITINNNSSIAQHITINHQVNTNFFFS